MAAAHFPGLRAGSALWCAPGELLNEGAAGNPGLLSCAGGETPSGSPVHGASGPGFPQTATGPCLTGLRVRPKAAFGLAAPDFGPARLARAAQRAVEAASEQGAPFLAPGKRPGERLDADPAEPCPGRLRGLTGPARRRSRGGGGWGGPGRGAELAPQVPGRPGHHGMPPAAGRVMNSGRRDIGD